jgi:murein L,D-transpeptidase YcbB/YkuD
MTRLNIVQAPWALLILLLVLSSACQHGGRQSQRIIRSKEALFSSDEARQAISAAFPETDSNKKGNTIASAMTEVYAQSDYQPIWVSEEGLTEDVQDLLRDLDSLKADGISPERYKVSQLRSLFEQLKDKPTLAEAVSFDTSCTHAYLLASRDLLLGILTPKKADSLWYHSNDSAWNAPKVLGAMASTDRYTSLATFRSRIPGYALLRKEYVRQNALSLDKGLQQLKGRVTGKTTPDSIVQAIIQKEVPWAADMVLDTLSPAKRTLMGYQIYYGLNANGKLDSNTIRHLASDPENTMSVVAANLERLRWLPQELEAQYVLVNVPLMELFYQKDGNNALNMRVVVGKPSRQTPSLNADMANVVFSPSWGVPPTILKQDVLPGINRSGEAYLQKKNLKAYDRKGRPVDASILNAGNIKNYTLKQPPGEDNALGEVKFNLPNRWDIYLHDTPHREDFPKPYRAKSSGCIRVERPRELAEFILRDIDGKDRFDQYTIDSIIQTRKTRFENLKQKIPVHIVYLTAFEDETGGRVRILKDIYGRDEKLMAMLVETGQ